MSDASSNSPDQPASETPEGASTIASSIAPDSASGSASGSTSPDRSPGHAITDRASDPALRFQRAALLLLLAVISAMFFQIVRGFLVAVLLAAIFAGMLYPIYTRLRGRLGDRPNWAAVLTIALLLLVVIAPLAAFLTVVVTESLSLSQSINDWIENEPDRLGQLRGYVDRLPFARRIIPDGEALIAQVGDLAGKVGGLLAGQAAALGRGTLNFALQLFIALYALFFFLVDGPRTLRLILYYLPLAPHEEDQLLERFVSVTRATLRGSLLIGVIQGALAGLAFWVSGVPAATLLGTATVVLSLVPAVGGAMIWIPAVIFLGVTGQTVAALGLLAWCMLVVSSVDNFLRPMLVGRDARMSDLLILLSTLGGISVFGVLGFIVGPIIAALFVTVWHIYGEAFAPLLPQTAPAASDASR